MANIPQLERIDEVRWRVPKQGRMRTHGLIFADERLMKTIRNDPCITQVANVAHLPGIVGPALAMPDIHWGYGFPIGGVAAFDPERDGIVSPGGVGYDINCGVRLHALQIDVEKFASHLDAVADALAEAVPAGVGVGRAEGWLPSLDEVLQRGAGALRSAGVTSEADLEAIEEHGCLRSADPGAVSDRARQRGQGQLGSLGSGNHFLEVDRVAEIYDDAAAAKLNLQPNGFTLLVHSGSRGLGHQVCEESLATMVKAAAKARIELPDRQLACAPLSSPEASHYLGAMAAAANFAFANRALLAHRALVAMAQALDVGKGPVRAPLVYDVCHNIAKWEEHLVDGKSRRLCVHRKGATRAFGPGHPSLPERFRELGQPVIIPGDMGRYSYVLLGQKGAMAETFGSACHGAGRLLARSQARKQATGREIAKEMAQRGIRLRAASLSAVVEEMPAAYKDVADVVSVVERAGLARKVARLEPVIVVKG